MAERPTGSTPLQRSAAALAEIQQLHEDYEALKTIHEQDQRTIARLEDRISMLGEELRSARQQERVAIRKLIRLATEMSGIGALARNAEEIMKSAKEWEETERELQAEKPAAQGDELGTDIEGAVARIAGSTT